jgi:hypothetical protein
MLESIIGVEVVSLCVSQKNIEDIKLHNQKYYFRSKLEIPMSGNGSMFQIEIPVMFVSSNTAIH